MILFTRHALLKLAQRRIAKNLVLQTLKAPDHITRTGSDGYAPFKKFTKLYLKVICHKQGKHIIVITQYWTEKIK